MGMSSCRSPLHHLPDIVGDLWRLGRRTQVIDAFAEWSRRACFCSSSRRLHLRMHREWLLEHLLQSFVSQHQQLAKHLFHELLDDRARLLEVQCAEVGLEEGGLDAVVGLEVLELGFGGEEMLGESEMGGEGREERVGDEEGAEELRLWYRGK